MVMVEYELYVVGWIYFLTVKKTDAKLILGNFLVGTE